MSQSNFRVFFPVEEIAIGSYGSASGIPVHGVQSASMTTNFSLEQVLELGQLNLYANLETVPSIEMTLEKSLDGYPLIYHLATQGATSPTLLNRSTQRCDVWLSIFSDKQDSSSGVPIVQAYCSGMYLNSLGYAIPLQGFARETVSLVGNDKIWITGSGSTWYGHTGFAFNGHFNNNDAPASGIQRRQNIILGSGGSVFPPSLPGISNMGGGSGYNIDQGGGLGYGAHLQDVNIQCNLSREDLFELGRRRPYYKYARFPVEVTCSVNITAGGTNPGDNIQANADTDNLTNETIIIELQDGSVFNLGSLNKLQSVSYSGGGADGSNVGLTFNYVNYNNLQVQSPSDPAHQ